MTIPNTNVTMSTINRALNRVSNTQINFSTHVNSINSANTMGSTRLRVKDYYCLIKGDGANNSNTITDYTNTYKTVTQQGVISTAQSKFGGASIYYSNTYTDFNVLTAPNNMTLTNYSGDWTMEGFTYWITGGDVSRFFTTFAGTVGDTKDSSVRVNFGNLQAYYFENGNLRNINGGALTQNVWFHWAFVKQGTTAYLYKDGVSQGSRAVSGSGLDLSEFRLGNDGAEFFQGYIDEVRFSNYARYPNGTTFTPPTASFAS